MAIPDVPPGFSEHHRHQNTVEAAELPAPEVRVF